jgi:hypothetical protein
MQVVQFGHVPAEQVPRVVVVFQQTPAPTVGVVLVSVGTFVVPMNKPVALVFPSVTVLLPLPVAPPPTTVSLVSAPEDTSALFPINTFPLPVDRVVAPAFQPAIVLLYPVVIVFPEFLPRAVFWYPVVNPPRPE